MRTNKQLVQLVLDSFPKYFTSGLCGVLVKMHTDNILSAYEWCTLRDLFEKHKPSKGYSRVYWWEPHNLKPRIEFLNNLLKQL